MSVDEGIAQIDGTATSLLEKQRATRIAEANAFDAGVVSVINELSVE